MKLWRSLVRFEDIDLSRGIAFVIVPGWDPYEIIQVPLECLPNNIDHTTLPGQRRHARVNIGAERKKDLFFTEWE